MTSRFLEAFFRHRWLVSAPAIIVPLIVAALTFSAPAPYDSSAGVWVEQSVYLNLTNDFNPYITPAQNQTNRLSELMRSRSFVTDVVQRTSLADLLDTGTGRDQIARLLTEGLEITPAGDHLVVVHFRADSPELALEVVSAIVAAFNSWSARDRTSQAKTAIGFYEAQLADAEERFGAANKTLQAYFATNPALRGPGGIVAPAAAFDARFNELQRDAQNAGFDADRIRTLLRQAQLDVAASQAGYQLGFQVVDPPQLPTAPTRQLRKILIYPAAAVFGGLLMSALLLLLFVLGDRVVRSESELPAQAAVIGVMPRLSARGIGRRAGAGIIRRGIGFVAGSSLQVDQGARLRA